ncbi:hypothetical protein P7K49_032403 [Saguinus oedipus]|uniref:Uncharacterized protein n=1 Tax=Saguinus oedipus TaxID=9490 RepID=A0ABQ9U018_SAGOE|nr:hypothetical protein P7K49_032403 [Saguinus oedipus]
MTVEKVPSTWAAERGFQLSARRANANLASQSPLQKRRTHASFRPAGKGPLPERRTELPNTTNLYYKKVKT